MPAAKTSTKSKSSKTAKRTAGKKARRKMNPEDLLGLHFVGSPSISPDGQRVVFTVKTIGKKNDYLTNLWMAGVGDKPRRFTSGDKDGSPRWSPDGARIAFISHRKKGSAQIAVIESGGGEARELTEFPEGSLGSPQWSPDGQWLAVAFRETDPDWKQSACEARKETGECDPPRVLDDPWYRLDGDGYFNGQRYRLYVVNANTGEHRLLYKQTTIDSAAFDISPDGKEIALVTSRDKRSFARGWTTEVVRIHVATGKAKAVKGIPPGYKDNLQWSPDGRRLAFSWSDKDGKKPGQNTELWVADLAKGTAKSLTDREDYCLLAITLSDAAEADFASAYSWTPDGKRLWVQIGWHGETHLATISAKGGPFRFHTSGKRQHTLGNLSANGSRIALMVGDATTLPEVHFADVPKSGTLEKSAALTLRRVSNLNAELLGKLTLSKPTSRWVKSSDGVKVQVWTMLPPGASKTRKRPTLLQVHGGPHAQYGWAFFHEFQVLAAQGYAVVFSNPRGSKGYGEDFCDGNSHSWGGQDWADVEAVAKDMSKQSFCNTKRMGISGGSFGGFMTLWAIGHTNMFRAAVSDRCVANMVSMWGSSDVYIWPDTEFPGNTWDDTKALWDMSPLKYLGNARTPTLVIHSEGDLRCNVAESEQAYSALATRGIPTRFVRYPRSTSHGMSRAGPPDMRLHRLQQYLDWWKRWMK
ncbi:MAG: S9 family peptidase [Planctomycetota bacterium]|nr:S9 family peptidase [Planctomycetota bacterium]